MALSNTTVKQSFTGNGSNKTFSFSPTVIESDSDEIKVYLRDESVTPATETLQVEGSDYELTGQSLPSIPFNNTVSFFVAPSSGIKVVLVRSVELTQTLDLEENGELSSSAVETALDRLAAQIQQTNERLDRSPILPVTEQVTNPISLPEPSPGSVLQWNAAGDGFDNADADNLSANLSQATHISLVKQATGPTADTGNLELYAKTDGTLAYKDESGTEEVLAVIGEPKKAIGTRSNPLTVVAATGIVFTPGFNEYVIFVKGSGGPVTVTATDPVQLGTIIGQEMWLVGRDDDAPVTLQHSAGKLELNGDISLYVGDCLHLGFDGTAWFEISRSK